MKLFLGLFLAKSRVNILEIKRYYPDSDELLFLELFKNTNIYYQYAFYIILDELHELVTIINRNRYIKLSDCGYGLFFNGALGRILLEKKIDSINALPFDFLKGYDDEQGDIYLKGISELVTLINKVSKHFYLAFRNVERAINYRDIENHIVEVNSLIKKHKNLIEGFTKRGIGMSKIERLFLNEYFKDAIFKEIGVATNNNIFVLESGDNKYYLFFDKDIENSLFFLYLSIELGLESYINISLLSIYKNTRLKRNIWNYSGDNAINPEMESNYEVVIKKELNNVAHKAVYNLSELDKQMLSKYNADNEQGYNRAQAQSTSNSILKLVNDLLEDVNGLSLSKEFSHVSKRVLEEELFNELKTYLSEGN